jgi:alpha-1,2-mannosyltransferase
LNGLIERLSDRAGWAFPVAILLGLVLLAMTLPVVRRLAAHGEHLQALLVSAGYGLLVSPVSWTHHWVWVVPLFGLVVTRAATTGRLWWPAAFCVVFTGWFQIVVPHGDNDELRWTFVQSIVGNVYLLTALIILTVLYRQIRNKSKADRQHGGTAETTQSSATPVA